MVNHNVRITFAVRIADGIATGIWASSVLSTYINVLEGDNDKANERVGYAQAIQGTFLAAAALPAGWLAITHRRDSILKVMGLVAFAAITTTSAALVLDVPYKYGLLCCGLALWGVAQANAPVLDALFADSVPTGNRSRLYTWLHMSYIVAQGIGPGVGAAMFALHGNVWRLEVLQRVMLVGMAMAAVPALLMLCFDDDQALGAESEGLLRAALLRPADEEEAEPEEPERQGVGARGSGDGWRHDRESTYTSYGSQYGSQSPKGGGGEPDYRRPFLEGWSSDTEQDFRNQVGPVCSPARPVIPTKSASVASRDGGCGGGDGRSSGNAPPHPVHAPSRDVDGRKAGPTATGGSSKSAPVEATAALSAQDDGGGATAAADAIALVAPAHICSHALLLSPATTASPTTVRSGTTTPGAVGSPPPPGANGADGATAADAVATRLWRVASPEQEAPVRGSAAAAAAAVAQRFHTVRQAVDGAAAAAMTGPSEGATLSASGSSISSAAVAVRNGQTLRESSVSIKGGAVAAATAAAAAAAGARSGSSSSSGGASSGADYVGADGNGAAAAGAAAASSADEYDSAVSNSREPALMAESLPSELSFNSLLGPTSFRSVHSRSFSRTASSSSCGSASARGGGTASGGASGGAAAPPPPGLLPHPEEPGPPKDARLGSGGGGDPDNPNPLELEPHRNSAVRQLLPVTLSEPPNTSALRPTQQAPPLAACQALDRGISSCVSIGSKGCNGSDSPNPPCDSLNGHPGATRGCLGGGAHDGVSGWSPPPPAVPAAVAAVAAREPPPQLRPAPSGLDPRQRRFLCLTMAWIPGVLALTDCTMGLASGMTIKFFPIFFKDQVRLAPMYVNLMYCAIPLCLSAASYIAQRESRVLGRVQTMVLNRGIGITLLYWIALHTERWHDQRLMVPVYIARTSIMNSIYPLQKSILMDFVPKERRAAWNSLEAVTSFGWSGSAALGGWLIHKFGFRATFLITATMQCMGWTMSMLLLPIVPRREAAGLQQPSAAAAATAATRRKAPTAARGGGGGGGGGGHRSGGGGISRQRPSPPGHVGQGGRGPVTPA